jgi:hypothetical protein
VDAKGYVYVVGFFDGVIQLPNLTLTAANGSHEAFALKLDPSGAPVWGRHFGSAGVNVWGSVVAVDSMGSVAMGGSIINGGSASVSFDSFTIAQQGMFVAKLDAGSGKVLWAKGLNTNVMDTGDVVEGIGFASTGDVVVGGKFAWPLVLGGTTVSVPSGQQCGFVGKLAAMDGSSTTTGGWALTLCPKSGTTSQTNSEVTGLRVIGQDDIVVAGNFSGELDTGTLQPFFSAGPQDGFVARLATSGAAIWLQQVGGANASVSVFSLAVSADGGPVLAGDFTGAITLSKSSGVTVSSPSSDRAFLVGYDGNDTYLWNEVLGCGQTMDATGNQCVIDGIATDQGGDVVLAGHFGGSLHLLGGATMMAAMPFSFFAAKLSTTQALLWSKSYGPVGGVHLASVDVFNYDPTGVAMSPQGNPVVFGLTSASLQLGWINLTPTGADGFIAQLSP